jgi:hypothetical protein
MYSSIRHRLVCAVASGVVWLLALLCHATPSPDPTTLVEGIESSRLQIPASQLHIHMVFKTAIIAKSHDVLVEFDGENRRYEDISGGPKLRGFFDGSQVALFDGSQVTLRDVTDDTGDLMFDPRLLGLTMAYSWKENIIMALPYRTASSIKLVGMEQVGDRSAWHIQLLTKSPATYQVDLWASGDDGFKVYKYAVSFEGGRTVATSYYDNTIYYWLPSKVESQSYNSEGELRFEQIVSLVEAKSNADLPKTAWTLAGLQLPTGTDIVDRRIKQRVGTWNGTAIRPIAPEPLTPQDQPKMRTFILCVFVISFVPLFYVLWKQKHNNCG